jgi:hypothetical protein
MEGTKYGYACVSTDDQTPALHLAAMIKARPKTVFKDRRVGSHGQSALSCLDFARYGVVFADQG